MMKDDEVKLELTKGSIYKIYSLGSRDNCFETQGRFTGFINIGMDETGLLIELDGEHGNLSGKTRIVPLHAILAIDVIKAEENEKKDDKQEISHYVG